MGEIVAVNFGRERRFNYAECALADIADGICLLLNREVEFFHFVPSFALPDIDVFELDGRLVETLTLEEAYDTVQKVRMFKDLIPSIEKMTAN